MMTLIQIVGTFMMTMLAATCAHAVALKTFPKLGLTDFPERYDLKRKPVPYPTGTIAVVLFILIASASQPIDLKLAGMLLGIVILATVSFIDDRKHVHPAIRLAVQALTALLIFGLGTRIYTITNPLAADGIIKLDSIVIPMQLFADPPLWSGIFTVAWLVLTINALNWFDGIPGQVSILSIIGFVTIGALALSSRVTHVNPALQHQLGFMAFVLAGLAAASALFDFPPNKVVMGDTGAMFFGLMLGVLTIYAGGKVATAFLVLGVPLIDSGIVVVRRLAKGKSPLKGDSVDEHLHHRLLKKGWSPRQVILLTVVLGSSFGLTALFLSTVEKVVAAALLFTVMLALSIYSTPKKSG